MAIAPYRVSTDLFRPFFEDILTPLSDGGRLGSLMRAPVADVVEGEAEIQVTLELPGMNADDIEINIENNVLTISGEKKEERTEGDENDKKWHLTERRYGHFSRSFVLPRDVDSDQIRASFENGILEVSIPKSERARRRKIEVQAETGRQRIGSESQRESVGSSAG